ncbi:calcium release-activated calcium channel protein 1-like [Centruroides vittatus]|uniref:calcium release-activated calcium channel protein 1-like n=1 Tax=Centruroides vittatus TaxID=120091 RepID=UPI00351095C6
MQILMKEMSKPENSVHALSWRRLHLSRAKWKASSRTSALLSEFAMVAMVEVQLGEEMPRELIISFSVCTILLVAVNILSLMISKCILPNVEAVASVYGIAAVSESPHEKMHVELAWACSTVFGIILFLSEIAILCWVKFYDYSREAALAATILLVPIVITTLAFAFHFYRKLVVHKYEQSAHGLQELENMVNQLHYDGKNLPLNGSHVINV